MLLLKVRSDQGSSVWSGEAPRRFMFADKHPGQTEKAASIMVTEKKRGSLEMLGFLCSTQQASAMTP